MEERDAHKHDEASPRVHSSQQSLGTGSVGVCPPRPPGRDGPPWLGGPTAPLRPSVSVWWAERGLVEGQVEALGLTLLGHPGSEQLQTKEDTAATPRLL